MLLLGVGCAKQDFSDSSTATAGTAAQSPASQKPGKIKPQAHMGHLTPIPTGTPAGLVVPPAQ